MLSAGHRGRVLLVGEPADTESLLASLRTGGFDVSATTSTEVLGAAARALPEAIVVAAADELRAADAVRSLRDDDRTRGVPLMLEGPEALLRSPFYRSLAVDDLLPRERADVELDRRLEALVRAKRLVDNEARARARLVALLDIAQAAASTLDLPRLLAVVVKKLSQVITSDRCAVLLLEKTGELMVAATVEDPDLGSMQLDLSRYPELALALQSRETVIIEDARSDPRMEPVRSRIAPLDVRSILVQPLISGEEVLGALFLRQIGRDRAFNAEDRDFARGAAAAVADHLRNARLHTDLKRKRDDLEVAYVDRYRELAAANRRLKELNQFKDELIAMCSHDLRAPLNVLLGHGQLLQEGGLTAPQGASAEAIVRQGRKILELVESLLERGRGEAVRLSLETAEIDLARQAIESAREMEILARERALSIRAEAPEEMWAIADPIKVRQVLQNLVQNALVHARKQVEVRAQRLRREGGDQARISVLDDGPGIAPEALPVIFDRYHHGPKGVRLGLAICREFVELHGGEIWAENLPEGGCAVRFSLPLRRDPGAVTPAERPRLLVVEDELDVAQAASAALRTRYRVEIARDGAEGLAKARALKPNLILMDVFLPKVDGLDAMAALKGAPDTADIPVIMVSAHPDVAEKLRALHLGAMDYIVKPFSSRLLLERVERVLAPRPPKDPPPQDLEVAGIDPLTGLLGRSGFSRRAAQEQARARRYQRPLSLAVIVPPLPPAEAALLEAVRALRATARAADIYAHLGDGAFALLLPECTPASARSLVRRLSPQLSPALGKIGVAACDAVEGELGELLAQLVGRAVAPKVRRGAAGPKKKKRK